MASSGTEPAASLPGPDLELDTRIADLGKWESEEYNYVLYADGLGEHLYAEAAVDLEAMI